MGRRMLIATSSDGLPVLVGGTLAVSIALLMVVFSLAAGRLMVRAKAHVGRRLATVYEARVVLRFVGVVLFVIGLYWVVWGATRL